MASVRVGAIFLPDLPPERLREIVRAAEDAGLGELWLWEDCFQESAFATAGAALAWTERLRVGIGIVPMPLRNVAVTAMEIATLERMFPGRLLPGLGHGVLRWMGQVGARVASPLTLMREYVTALRALLDGSEVTVSGRYVTLDRVRLDWPPAAPVALYAAGEGPKTLALTGELADGTVLTGGTVDSAREAVARVRGGREAAGRDGAQEVVLYLATAFGPDAAERAAAQQETWDVTGWSEHVVTGGVDDIARAVAEYAEVGVGAVILEPLPNEPDHVAFMAQAAEVGARLGV